MEPRDVAGNGHETVAWRLVAGRPELSVVDLGFTIHGQEHESYEEFRERMMRFTRRWLGWVTRWWHLRSNDGRYRVNAIGRSSCVARLQPTCRSRSWSRS